MLFGNYELFLSSWIGQKVRRGCNCCNPSPSPGIEGAEYKGDGSWLHRASGGGGIFAISREVEPGVHVYDFLATSSVGGAVFKTLKEAVAWLDGLIGAA